LPAGAARIRVNLIFWIRTRSCAIGR